MTAVDAARAHGAGAEQHVILNASTAVSVETRPKTEVQSPRAQPSLERRRLWERHYARRLRVTDGLTIVSAALATAALDLLTEPDGRRLWGVVRIAVLLVLAWSAVLWLWRTRESSILGTGTAEYKRVAQASGVALGILAMLFVAFQWEGLRLQLLIALPAGMVALLFERWLWRRWLMSQWKYGQYSSRVIVTGAREEVESVIRSLSSVGQHGFVVVGITTPEGPGATIDVDGQRYPVIGPVQATAAQARLLGADSVIVAGRPEDDPGFVRRLSWQLEGTASELILSSGLTDVAGPRLSLRQIDGLPLINVKIPEYEGGAYALKRALDIVFAGLALIPTLLVLPLIAAAIRIDSRGPIFFLQTRVGRDGREFRMIKFRTMTADAEARLAGLKEHNEGSGLLFKMKRDPRVTEVGAILRKFSLDELPQFFNVLRGDMSVVGPRPPLPSEVTAYDGTVYRRLYIKPGITGLWQVSGRSDLTWDESVRLDLRYVENWSLTKDLQIMWRTAKAMVAPRGAY